MNGHRFMAKTLIHIQTVLRILDQQAAYEVLGQLAGVAEVFLVKVVVDSRDVGEGFLLGLPQEG